MLNPSWLNEDDDNLNRFNSIDLYATDEDDFDGVDTYTSKAGSIDQED
jgi:hypothetical protein